MNIFEETKIEQHDRDLRTKSIGHPHGGTIQINPFSLKSPVNSDG